MRLKKSGIHFQARRHSIAGGISVIIGLSGIAVLSVLSWRSGLNGGNSGISAGIGGAAVMLLSACGFPVALRSFREKDIYYTSCIAGLLLNGMLFAVCLGLYMIGLGI